MFHIGNISLYTYSLILPNILSLLISWDLTLWVLLYLASLFFLPLRGRLRHETLSLFMSGHH